MTTLTSHRLPTTPQELTVDLLNQVIGELDPSALLSGFEVIESHVYGSGKASTSGRIILAPAYRNPSDDLPRQLVMKVAHAAPTDPTVEAPPSGAHGTLYDNEATIYGRLKPWQIVEAPRAIGAAYDTASQTQLIILEDLRERGGTFPLVTTPVPLAQMESLIDELASLHARYWNSPELKTTLSWMQHHTSGDIHHQFTAPDAVPAHIAHQVETVQFKREMIERMGLTVHDLYRQHVRNHLHQATLAQTVCHGDTHIANTYGLPENRAGLLDWQLSCIGHSMHDISYILATGQTVADRRSRERDLLARYRERLLQLGARDVPSFDAMWLEYRRAMVWCVYIGWLTTPVVNYGWDVCVMAHLRVMTAYEDHETAKAIAALD